MVSAQGPETIDGQDGGLPGLASGTSVAVTGGTGFIGGRLVERLARCGAETTCLIRGRDAGTRLHRAGARIRRLDLVDLDAVRAALAGVEVVFHLAYDWEDEAWNLAALQSLIAACTANGCRRLVHVSSFVVYDLPQAGSVSEDTAPTTATQGYAHVKRRLEQVLLDAVRARGVPATIVQPTIVYGPLSRSWTLDPAESLRHGTVILPDAGEGTCNAVYVDDVVSAMMLAAERPTAIGQRYLVSGPAPVTWRTFYDAMARAVGAKGPRFRPAQAIRRANGPAGRVGRLLRDPELAIRRVAGIGPVRRLVTTLLRVLPGGLRRVAQQRLYVPASRRNGHVHLPDAGHLAFLQSRTTIGSEKARQELGYAPAFDFERGMEPTARFLRDRFPQGR